MPAGSKLLILTLALCAANDAAARGEPPLFHCDFEANSDINFDQRPDGWGRFIGPGFPAYLPCALEAEADDPQNHVLAMRLNGAQVAIYSPPIHVDAQFSYVIQCRARASRLLHNGPAMSLRFLKDAEPVGSAPQATTPPWEQWSWMTGGGDSWAALTLGPLSPPAGATAMVVGLHLAPLHRAGEFDIEGAAFFDDVMVIRQPTLALSLSSPFHMYSDPTAISIACETTGVTVPDARVRLTIENEQGEVVFADATALSQAPLSTGAARPPHGVGPPHADSGAKPLPEDVVVYQGRASWRPPIPGVGFYRARVQLVTEGASLPGRAGIERTADFVVLPPSESTVNGEFGWSLSEEALPVPLEVLPGIVKRAGIHWVKLPLLARCQEPRGAFAVAEFTERLLADNIRVVGVLEQPPDALREALSLPEHPTAADTYSLDPALWFPHVEPIVLRLLRIRWWQLGSDADHSFEGLANLREVIAGSRARLRRFGSDIQVGTSWRWPVAPPHTAAAELDFVQLDCDPPLAQNELQFYLPRTKHVGFQRWVSINPLSKDAYSAEVRRADFVRRMIAAKQHGAEKIFLTRPFDAQRGIMNSDGTPGELFLPWRTAAMALGGKSYAGSLELPARTPNAIFQDGEQGTIALWSDHPHEETLPLDEAAVAIDAWGRPVELAQGAAGTRIHVGPVPTFVTGLAPHLLQHQLSIGFANTVIPSLRGRPVKVDLQLQNPFPRSISGQVHLELPNEMEGWRIEPPVVEFHVAPGKGFREAIEFRIPFDAATKEYELGLLVRLFATRRYQFRLTRRVRIGFDDLEVRLFTEMDPEGNLIVEQHLRNGSAEAASFDCLLRAQGRPPIQEVIRSQADGSDVLAYRLAQGRELVGTTLLLRVRERDGLRFLNFYVPVPDFP